MEKKLIIPLLFLIMAVVGVSGCTQEFLGNETNNDSLNLTTYAADGISFQYPAEWTEYEKTEQYEIVTVGNYSTYTVTTYSNDSAVNSSREGSSGILIEFDRSNKTDLSANEKLSNIKSHDEFKNQTFGNRTIAGINATTVIGDSETDEGEEYKEMYIIFDKDNYSYTIRITVVPPEDFEASQEIIDIILNSFQITE